jgi:gluconokinase
MVIVLTGVSGSGKSTVGKRLAQHLDFEFHEGDDYHTESSRKKMQSGQALTEADRAPWLAALNKLVSDLIARNANAVLAFSGLKQAHRDSIARNGVKFVYLKGDPALIGERLGRRKGHFFDPKLLDSQFETLEEPGDVLAVDVNQSPETLVRDIVRELGLEAGVVSSTPR